MCLIHNILYFKSPLYNLDKLKTLKKQLEEFLHGRKVLILCHEMELDLLNQLGFTIFVLTQKTNHINRDKHILINYNVQDGGELYSTMLNYPYTA